MNADSVDAIAPFTLLVAIDYSAQAGRAVEIAKRMVERTTDAVVHVVNVFTPSGSVQTAFDTIGASSSQPGIIHADNELDLYCQRLQEEMAVPVVAHLRVGKKPAEQIVSLAQEVGADLIIVGTHGRTGIGRALLGSVAESISRSATCPVLIARDAKVPQAADMTIDPPCPDCLAARFASKGQEWWCAAHHQRHPRPHTYRQLPEGFAYGSTFLRPE